MDILIRKAEDKDSNAINSLFIEMLFSVYGTTDGAGYEEGYLERYYNDTGDTILIAEDGDLPVGFLSVQIHDGPPQYIYLDDFSVTESYRSMGIGTALMDRAEAYAAEKGISAILLHVERSNNRAAALYGRRGYRQFRDDGDRTLLVKDI